MEESKSTGQEGGFLLEQIWKKRTRNTTTDDERKEIDAA